MSNGKLVLLRREVKITQATAAGDVVAAQLGHMAEVMAAELRGLDAEVWRVRSGVLLIADMAVRSLDQRRGWVLRMSVEASPDPDTALRGAP